MGMMINNSLYWIHHALRAKSAGDELWIHKLNMLIKMHKSALLSYHSLYELYPC